MQLSTHCSAECTTYLWTLKEYNKYDKIINILKRMNVAIVTNCVDQKITFLEYYNHIKTKQI